MLHVIAVIIYLGVAFLLYRYVLKHRENVSLGKKEFLGTLLSGALPCTLCIIVCELLFDRFVLESSNTIGEEIFTSFFRAALIEEALKLVFCRRVVKKRAPATRVECMLLCGMIGAGYGLIEKLAYGGGIILIANAFLPLHIFFQFLMGALLFDVRRTDGDGDASRGKKKKFLVFFLPFLVHGCWDSLLAVAGWLLDREGSTLLETAGLLLMLVLVVGGVIGEIRTVKKMSRMA